VTAAPQRRTGGLDL